MRQNSTYSSTVCAMRSHAYHTNGVLRHHLWCLSTPPQCGIPTFTVGTCSHGVKIKMLNPLSRRVSEAGDTQQHYNFFIQHTKEIRNFMNVTFSTKHKIDEQL